MIEVTFADLTHTGVVIDANYTPLSVGYIAAYAKHHLNGEIDVRLFKYPDNLARYLAERKAPRIACFSNYMWNERLQCEFARRMKLRHPKIVTVFGGPNYPTDAQGQVRFLKQHPEIDFYIDGEGEAAFVELFRALEADDFDPARLKANPARLPNVCYLAEGTFVQGEMLPRIRDLDANLPSPYLMGLMDEFFDDKLHPLVQTSRGCPYSCTFCHDGILYMNKTLRFSQGRVRAELEYICDRVKVPGLTLADLNWGIFRDDLETAQTLARLKQERGWPRNIASATAKNHKDRIVEMSRILGGSIQIGAAVQSTDPVVLANIKRENIGYDAIVKMAKGSVEADAPTFSEVILCLPGDTKEKHFKSVFDMIDAGIQDMRTYQFILLPGTEAADDESRAKFAYETRFRVLPRCFGRYSIDGEEVAVAEIHEVCVGNNTMPFEDYRACRDFNLTLAIFNNGNIFEEVFGLAEVLRIPRSKLIGKIHAMAMEAGGKVEDLYRRFRADEERNFWKSRDELEAFLSGGGIYEYLSGNYGANQIFKYRSIAVFELLEEIAEIALAAMRAELREKNLLDPLLDQYFTELRGVISARKSRVTKIDEEITLNVHFDFVALDGQKYLTDPREFYVQNGISISVFHADSQRQVLGAFFRQYGTTMDGLAYFIHRNPARLLYRELGYADRRTRSDAVPPECLIQTQSIS